MPETLHGGFIAGVDDYLTKPADMKELVLRVRALLRRSGAAEANRLVIGAAVLDANRNTIERGGEKVELPSKEFQLLFRLLSTPGRAYTRMQLLDEVWGWDTESSEATVNVHVNRPALPFRGLARLCHQDGARHRLLRRDRRSR